MRFLVLGGSGFVGRALVEAGLERGWSATTFNRGTRPADQRVASLVGDRLDPATLAPLAALKWDVVADTWSGAPRAVRDSATLLAPRAGRYLYVSSGSVYGPPPRGGDESAPTAAAAPDAEDGPYPQNKRGGELAALASFGDRALLARAGLILGPHEDVGRLPWWLLRMARGGDVLVPGPPELPLQLIDARDLAGWMLDTGASGPFNVVGDTTARELFEAIRAVTGGHARLCWLSPQRIAAAGIEPWEELPGWLPAGHEYRGLLEADASRARAAGLVCRPVLETVRDTWDWLRALPGPPPHGAGRPAPGLDPEKEAAALRAG